MDQSKTSENLSTVQSVEQRRLFEIVGLLVCATLLVLLRWHAFELPLETDECNYAQIAARLLGGDRLYVDVWDHQPPGIFMLFAGAIALAGDGPIVFRLLAMASSLVSLLLVFQLVNISTRSVKVALVATLLFAMASSDPGTAGEGCNREIFMNTAILAAWVLLFRKPNPSDWSIGLAGFSLGIGSLIKMVVAVHWVVLAIWMVSCAWRRISGTKPIRQSVLQVALFAVGPAAIWILTTLYFSVTGRFNEFVDAVFLFNLSYSDQPAGFFDRFAEFFTPRQHPFIFDSAFILWLLGGLSLCWLLVRAALTRERKHERCAAGLIALCVSSYLATCLPGRFWPHYYYLMIPALVVLVPSAIWAVAETMKTSKIANQYAGFVAFTLLGITVASLGWTEYRDYLNQPPFGITVKRYNSRDFWGRAIGEKIRSVTEPTDSIFVYGNEAEIYYYAQRRCASRYTMITGLGGDDPGAQTRRKRMLDDLQQNRPRVIVVLFDEKKPFPAWQNFLRKHYGVAVGWDCHDRYSSTCASPNPKHVIMLVFVDKTQPIPIMDWSWDRSEVGGWIPKQLVKQSTVHKP